MTDGYRPASHDSGSPASHTLSIPLYLILTIVTVGLFNLYWNYRQIVTCNDLLEREEFRFGMWFLLCLVTCGLYHLYHQYRMGEAINEIQRSHQLPVMKDLPIISLLVTLFGLAIVADCIHQNEINKIDAELE